MYLQGFGHVLHSNQTQNGNARRDRHAHDDGELACQDISLAVPFGSPVVHARLFALERPMRTPALVLFLVARLANLGDGCLMLVLAFCVRLLEGVERDFYLAGVTPEEILALVVRPRVALKGEQAHEVIPFQMAA